MDTQEVGALLQAMPDCRVVIRGLTPDGDVLWGMLDGVRFTYSDGENRVPMCILDAVGFEFEDDEDDEEEDDEE